jgi:tetratricopeptide (TPR) repeat protein
VYRLADYVEQAGATLRANVYPPPSFWQAASRTIRDASALRALGWAAEQRGRYQHAALLYRASIENGELASFKALLRLIDHTGGPADTVVNLCRSAADLGCTDAMNHLAFLQERAGDRSSAAELYRRAADRGDVDARQALDRLSEPAGDEHPAARAATSSDTEPPRTIAQRGERAGDLDRVAVRFPDAVGQQDRDTRLRQQTIERAHTNALIALAHTRHQAGDFAGAVAAARQAAERGQTGVLSQLALHLDQQGDPGGAVRLAHEAADRGNPIVLSRLARRRELAGDPDGAAGLYREAVNRANINAMINLARLHEQAGDTDSAMRIRRFGLDAQGSPAEPWTTWP